jgi:trk system potassium uptake protein TrkH
LRLYAIFLFLSAAVVAAIRWAGAVFFSSVSPVGPAGLERAARGAAFQTASFLTTTGFASENYFLWPRFVRGVLMLLAFVGGCAGSTGGGLKVVRVLLLLRCIGLEIRTLLHPRAILHTRVNGAAVSPRALDAVLAFFALYVAFLVAASLAALAAGEGRLGAATAFFGTAVSLSNLGPGINRLGTVESYAWLPGAVKWIFSFCMLAGRLELYPIILLFYPSAWAR